MKIRQPAGERAKRVARARESGRACARRSSSIPTALLLLVLVVVLPLLFAVPAANAHGYLASPISRNLLASEKLGYSCPHCLNLGGVDTVSQQRELVWPDGHRTLSGDPISERAPRSFEAGGEFYRLPDGGENVYVAGDVLPITIVTTTNHNGRFGFRICKVSGGYDGATIADREAEQLTEECLDQNVLVQADVAGAQAPGQRWFYTPVKDAGKSVQYTMSYVVPEDLECDGISSHCVLQWYWLTFNSCQTADAPAKFTRSSNKMANCDEETASYPEEFANLADIKVVRSEADAASIRDAAILQVAGTDSAGTDSAAITREDAAHGKALSWVAALALLCLAAAIH
jgi:hypothetical protein